jgi:hypothetical protein
MKTVLLSALFAGLLATSSNAQCNAEAAAAQMQTLLGQSSSNDSVRVLTDQRAVQIGAYLFPLAHTTQLKWRKSENGTHQVEFYLQNGTAITDVREKTFRRASWSIPFASRQASEAFVQQFNCLRTTIR